MKTLSQILGTIEEATKIEKPKFINFRGMKDEDLLLWLKSHVPTKKTSKEDKDLWVIARKIADKKGLKESKTSDLEMTPKQKEKYDELTKDDRFDYVYDYKEKTDGSIIMKKDLGKDKATYGKITKDGEWSTIKSYKESLETLAKIIEKADDVYNTISLLGEDLESEESSILIKSLYNQAHTLYEKVDIDHGIVPAELDESLSWKMTIKTLTRLGFKEVENPSKDTYTTKKGRIQHLFGIPMRANKWADVFFVILDSEKKPYGIIDDEKETWYEKLGEALEVLNKFGKENRLQNFVESSTDINDELSEVLDPNADASVWIHDFVHSENERFEGKTKEERINMALGAWYKAREKKKKSKKKSKKEDVTHDEVIDNSMVE